MASLYTFAEYSPAWPDEFANESARLGSLLGDALVAVHHIGSTSVPGLAAKPTVDLLPVVRDIAEVDSRTARLEAAGYKAWGEYGLPRRRLFTKDRDGRRTHNIHIYQAGDSEIERHVAFCAYLQANDAVRREYEALKREVYARHPADIEAYCDGKDAWIKRMEPDARAWYRERNRTD